MNCIATFEHAIDGVKAMVRVTRFHRIKPWAGPASRCPSDLDSRGYVDLEYDVLDEHGDRSYAIDSLRTRDVDEAIQQAIINHIEG